MNKLMIGVSGLGVLHTDASVFDTDTKFRMVKESGASNADARRPLSLRTAPGLPGRRD
jgi:hypothetical protein